MSQGPLLDQACLLAAQGPDSEPARIPISVATMIQCTCRIPTGRASGSASSCALAASGGTDTGLMCLSAKTPAHHTTRVMGRRSRTEENMGRLCDSRPSPALTECYASRPRNTYHGLGRKPEGEPKSLQPPRRISDGISCVSFSMRVSERNVRTHAGGGAQPSGSGWKPICKATTTTPNANAAKPTNQRIPFSCRSIRRCHPPNLLAFLPPGRGGQIF